MEKQLKIILIGPVTNVSKGLIGGATISFGYLIDYLNRNKIQYHLVNTQLFTQGIKRILNPILTLVKVLLHAPFANVIFLNSSRGGTKYLVPILFVIAKVFRLKFVFRPFGGDIKDYTAKYNSFWKWLFEKTALKSDILFLQTKALMKFYANKSAHTVQLPTSRDEPSQELKRSNRPYEKRFIFLGFVNEAKGINEIIGAIRKLGKNYAIHIYGPIKEEKYVKIFDQLSDVYQGVLPKEKVLSTLREYDVLILPTYYEGEGYPGSIIEAYSLGLPVITTNWKAIPEIVDREKTGILIEPKSTAQLVAAIQHFDTCDYAAYRKSVQNYFVQTFSTDQVIGKAFESIQTLFNK